MTAPTTPSPERQPADAGGGLLPCPWCGGELYVSVQDIDNFIGHVECGGCDMRGPISEWKYEDPEEAKADAVERWNAAWNRRSPAPQAQPDARAMEALKAANEALAMVTAFESDARYIMGNTNFSIFQQRREQVKQALQALSAPAADDGWRPIETAPKDGTDVLVCLSDTVAIAHWSKGLGGSGWLDDSGAGHHDYWNYVGLISPTHWRPLPAPPAALHPAAPTDEVGKS